MDGSSIDDDWEFSSPSNGIRTLVLVGRTGNGKSATGNSIFQKEAFFSRARSAGVTSTCEMHGTVLKDGQILNIIDTPGLFDCSVETEFIGKEIIECINMAKDGIHAVLVLTVRSRFSKEEEDAVNSLRTLFGNKITDYMIVVFTGGDELEKANETLEDFLGRDCPEPLKEILHLCGNRRLLFNNSANDQRKKDKQVQDLLSLVNIVLTKTGGKPYTDEFFMELKKGAVKLHDQTEGHISSKKYSVRTEQMHIPYEEQLKRITEMARLILVELRLRENTYRLEKQLAEEQVARLNVENMAKDAQMKSNDEIHKVQLRLRENTYRFEKQLAEEQVARLNAGKMAEDAQMKSNDEIHKLRESLEKAHKEAAERVKCVIL